MEDWRRSRPERPQAVRRASNLTSQTSPIMEPVIAKCKCTYYPVYVWDASALSAQFGASDSVKWSCTPANKSACELAIIPLLCASLNFFWLVERIALDALITEQHCMHCLERNIKVSIHSAECKPAI